MTVKAAPSLSFDSLATTPLPERGSKYIGFHEGGFLQVAVSEAPLGELAAAHSYVTGRSRYSTKTFRELTVQDFYAITVLRTESKLLFGPQSLRWIDRKSTRLNSSHLGI